MSMETILSCLPESPAATMSMRQRKLAAAVKRMEREGISIFDILDQPRERLYQSSLMRLAEVVAKKQYPDNRIERADFLEKLYYLITSKFQPEGMKGQGSRGNQQGAKSGDAGADRAAQAQAEYEKAQAEKNEKERANTRNQGSTKTGSEQRTWSGQTADPTEPQKMALWEKLKHHSVSKFIIPHPQYLSGQLWHDLAHDIKMVVIVFFAVMATGYLFGFLLSGYFVYREYYQVANAIYCIGMYIGATASLNFYLWKHRNYTWQ
jgi:hypothetical protein